MSYGFSYKDQGFVLCFKGHVTIEELNKANGEIHAHPEFDSHCYQIVDLLEADLSSVSKDDAKIPAAIDAAASTYRWGIKVALVAREVSALEAAYNYVEQARRLAPRWEFNIFPTRTEALEWART